MAKKKTKLVMSLRTKSSNHLPTSKHLAKKGRGGKARGKKVAVKC